MLIILIGNIGTGKTYYRQNNFKSNEKVICPDEWSDLGYDEKNLYLISEIHKHLHNGDILIVDGNNITKKSRKKYFKFAKLYKSKIIGIDFGKGNELTLKRRLSERPFEEHPIWTESHFYYLNKYEKPTIEEGFNEIIKVINY